MFKFFSKTHSQNETTEKQRSGDKFEDESNLVNYISHEVRTPIHGVANIALFLHENWDTIDDADRKKYLAVISSNSQRLINFTNELLDLSKFRAGKMLFNFSKIDMLPLVEETVSYFQNLILLKGSLKIIFSTTIAKACILGDSARMGQVLTNLFNNAIKYTSEGTIIANLSLVSLDNIGYVKFSLTDTGIGIPENELESIFEVFARSSRTNINISGTGIGLSICKEIVSAHKGFIRAENNRRKGSKFTFVIPACREN